MPNDEQNEPTLDLPPCRQDGCPPNCAACAAGRAFSDHSCPTCDDTDRWCDEGQRLELAWMAELVKIGEYEQADLDAYVKELAAV